MYAEDTGNRSTACGLEAGTPETAVTTTTTTIWTFGGEEAQFSTVSSTLAPSVGPPHFVPVDRRNTGYVSLNQPTLSRLETPVDFRGSTRSQASPLSERYSGDNHNLFGTMRAPKNVTFRGVRRRGYKDDSSSSDASDEDFSCGPNGNPGGHFGG